MTAKRYAASLSLQETWNVIKSAQSSCGNIWHLLHSITVARHVPSFFSTFPDIVTYQQVVHSSSRLIYDGVHVSPTFMMQHSFDLLQDCCAGLCQSLVHCSGVSEWPGGSFAVYHIPQTSPTCRSACLCAGKAARSSPARYPVSSCLVPSQDRGSGGGIGVPSISDGTPFREGRVPG